MKTFDEILEAAFDAGRERGHDERQAEESFVDPSTMAPTFSQWRPSLGDVE